MEAYLYGGAGEVYLGFEEGATPLAFLEEVSLRVLWPHRELAGDWEAFTSEVIKGPASVRVSALARLVPEGNPLWRSAGGLGWFEGWVQVPEDGKLALDREPIPETLSVWDGERFLEDYTLVGSVLRLPQELQGKEVLLRYAFEAGGGFELWARRSFALLLVFPILGGGYRVVRLPRAELVGYEELHQREDFTLARLEFAAAGAPEVSLWKG